jgi:excisionase family DNA binding protein
MTQHKCFLAWLRQVLAEHLSRDVATTACQRALGKQEVVMTPRVRREFETLSSAAERTGLSIRTLRRRIASGELAAYRNGARVIRVDPEDVDRLMVPIPTARC